MGRLAMHSRRCLHVLAVLEAVLLCNAATSFLEDGDGVHPLSDGDEGLQQRALHALEDPAVMEESTLGQRVARGDLSGKEEKILLKAHGEDMAATAQAAVALRGEANKQVADAHTIQLREKADQVRLRKLVSYDNDQIRGEEAELSVQKDELRHAEKVAPHLDTEILLQKEGTFIANAKAQYRKNAADADIAKRKARKLRRESAALAKEAMVPAKRSSKEADPALVAHSERVNAEHAKAMKDLKASVARYVTAIASSRQVRNNAEDSIYHLVPVLVEEAKKGLDESQKHPDDVDSWNKGKPKTLMEDSLVLLQDTSDADEIAQKAFRWEQTKQDDAAMKAIQARVAARTTALRQQKAADMQLAQVAESAEKRRAKHEQLRRAKAKAQQREAWEISAKAFRSTEEETDARKKA